MPLVILLFALFASLFTFSKTALEFTEPFFLIGSRMTFAGILLLLHQLVFNSTHFVIQWRHWVSLVTLALVSIYITNVAEIWGLQYMSSAKVCLIYSLSPFVSAILAYWLLKEKLTPKKWLGLCIGFIGLLPILLMHSAANELAKEMLFFSWAELAIIVAVLASVYGWILLKKIISQYHYTPIMANGVSMLLGGICALTHSYLIGEAWQPIPVMNGQYGRFIECALWMTLISNIICYNLYGHLLKRFSATFMSLAGLVTPLFASLFGWYFLDETISWHFFASMLLFSIGLAIFYQQEITTSLRLETIKDAELT